MIWGQTLAGALLGALLAIGLCGLYALTAWPSFDSALVTAVMLVLPSWVAILAMSFRFRSGIRAWTMLGAMNLICYGVIWLLRTTGVAAVPG